MLSVARPISYAAVPYFPAQPVRRGLEISILLAEMCAERGQYRLMHARTAKQPYTEMVSQHSGPLTCNSHDSKQSVNLLNTALYLIVVDVICSSTRSSSSTVSRGFLFLLFLLLTLCLAWRRCLYGIMEHACTHTRRYKPTHASTQIHRSTQSLDVVPSLLQAPHTKDSKTSVKRSLRLFAMHLQRTCEVASPLQTFLRTVVSE